MLPTWVVVLAICLACMKINFSMEVYYFSPSNNYDDFMMQEQMGLSP